MDTFDSPDPHFERKVRSIRSPEEMQGFMDQLRAERRQRGERVTQDELALMIRRGAEIKRGAGKAV